MKKTLLALLLGATTIGIAQTDLDGIMMQKNNFCFGTVYESSQWDHYWEGTLLRTNQNLGTVSTQKLGIMGNYGVSKTLNLLFNVPYIKTQASQGTLIGQEGIQDLNLTAKYMPYEKETKNAVLSIYLIGDVGIPLTNYVADYLPLSIGLHSKTATFRLMGDYQYDDFFATASGSYTKRSNITIDRHAYYTTEMHYTNEVDLPDYVYFNLRGGYRTNRLIAELIYDQGRSQGKNFDIARNNMPFPSNSMHSSKLGFNSKYYLKNIPGLSLIAGYNQVLTGRNVGQAKTAYAGLFYIVDFTKKATSNEK